MTKEEIATTLKLCRIRAGLDAKDVANKLISMGIIKSVKSFYNWESGRTQPDADTFLYLCDLYNVSDIMKTFGFKGSYCSSNELNDDEESIIKKYRLLDQRGKQAVNDTLDRELSYIIDDKKQTSEMSEIASDAIQTIDKISENMFKNQNDSVRKK